MLCGDIKIRKTIEDMNTSDLFGGIVACWTSAETISLYSSICENAVLLKYQWSTPCGMTVCSTTEWLQYQDLQQRWCHFCPRVTRVTASEPSIRGGWSQMRSQSWVTVHNCVFIEFNKDPVMRNLIQVLFEYYMICIVMYWPDPSVILILVTIWDWYCALYSCYW